MSISPILGRGSVSGESMTEDDLVRVHHDLMTVYGWIPLHEFSSLPLPTVLSLNKLVQGEISKREGFRLTSLKFYGVKNPK